MKKRLLSLLLVGVMASGLLVGCGQEASENKETAGKTEESVASKNDEASEENSKYPEYLNLDGYRPIVNEDEEITLRIAVLRTVGAETIPMEDLWFVKYLNENLNINVEWDEWTYDNMSERKNLMLTGNDMPDMVWNGSLGGDINQYGVDNEMFLPISDWVSEELTPNLYEQLSDPSIYDHSKAKDGKVYAVSRKSLERKGAYSSTPKYRVFIDSKFLNALGMEEAPDTLDGFVDFLREVKELDPASMGLEEIVPYVPRGDKYFITWYLSTAFGWAPGGLLNDFIWDETEQEVVIPYFQEKYLDYVRLLNTLYTEGLIHEDTYTYDPTEARAHMLNAAVIDDDAAFVARPDDWKDFVLARPLKSEYNNGVAVATTWAPISGGQVIISANTEYPELCLRLMDYLYSPEGSTYFTYGPEATADEEIKHGQPGFTVDPSTGVVTIPGVKAEEGVDNWIHSNICPTMGVVSDPKYYLHTFAGVDEIDFKLNLEDGNDYLNNTLAESLKGGQKLTAVMTAPYMTEEQIERYTDLSSLVFNYAATEETRFIVGDRPIEELDEFQQELMDMGGTELLELKDEIFADFEYVPYDFKYFVD